MREIGRLYLRFPRRMEVKQGEVNINEGDQQGLD